MTAEEKCLEIARREIGYQEKKNASQLDDKNANAGKNNYTKYARDLDALGVYNYPKNGYAWCDVFVDWVYVMAFGADLAWKMTGQPMKGCGAGCSWSVKYYQSIGRWYTNPKPADQIFFKDSGGSPYHTGIVERVSGNRVFTIEGNTTSSDGVVADGGCVVGKSYALTDSRIAGYGRPRWELAPAEEPAAPEKLSNAKQQSGSMTLEEFKSLWREMRKELQDNDASDYSAEARDWAVQTGLVQGGSSREFNGMWEDLLTREQMVTLLYRIAQMGLMK